jgi:hypothetical protein
MRVCVVLCCQSVQQVDTVRGYHFGEAFLVEVDVVLPPATLLTEAHDIGESLQVGCPAARGAITYICSRMGVRTDPLSSLVALPGIALAVGLCVGPVVTLPPLLSDQGGAAGGGRARLRPSRHRRHPQARAQEDVKTGEGARGSHCLERDRTRPGSTSLGLTCAIVPSSRH